MQRGKAERDTQRGREGVDVAMNFVITLHPLRAGAEERARVPCRPRKGERLIITAKSINPTIAEGGTDPWGCALDL